MGTGFWGDVVLESFYMVYRDEGSILDQNYAKDFFWGLYFEDFLLSRLIEENSYLKKQHITTRNS